MSEETVVMMCLTTKQKFEVVNPEVVVLNNGRYAYREKCPWLGKNGKVLYAFKFCSQKAHKEYTQRMQAQETQEPSSPESAE